MQIFSIQPWTWNWRDYSSLPIVWGRVCVSLCERTIPRLFFHVFRFYKFCIEATPIVSSCSHTHTHWEDKTTFCRYVLQNSALKQIPTSHHVRTRTHIEGTNPRFTVTFRKILPWSKLQRLALAHTHLEPILFTLSGYFCIEATDDKIRRHYDENYFFHLSLNGI